MRKLVFGAAAAACLGMAAPAMAGGMYDGSMKDAPVEPIVHAPIWAGLYVGGSLGFGVGDTSGQLCFDGSCLDFLSSDYDVDGAVYGAHIGYNWQHGHKVFGIEAALNGTDIDGSEDCGPFFNFTTCERELDYYATVVGRLGYAVNNLLFYGFGGVAWGEVETDVSILGQNLFDGSETHVGWTGGIGIETALTERFFAGVEYAHVDLGEEDLSFDICHCEGTDKVDMDFDVIKIRASYKLWDRGQEPLESYK
ncbi:outer membrane protein [Dichotomicrobium thermohalophilum]|uniref:Outer membrane immunogenic protein n=1 Tax=Dichotomicrobium thermohalophilum TaxID=933063 RepID=A0A397Q8F4_9HYPH|nr:outer membrane beta-barrel protein [Dichotomicrobium thermohalophilum]RIA56105.1 outer membrane immunogenic protein [Dichotomicrobium thermohalophilum]